MNSYKNSVRPSVGSILYFFEGPDKKEHFREADLASWFIFDQLLVAILILFTNGDVQIDINRIDSFAGLSLRIKT